MPESSPHKGLNEGLNWINLHKSCIWPVHINAFGMLNVCVCCPVISASRSAISAGLFCTCTDYLIQMVSECSNC